MVRACFDDVIGQPTAIELLVRALEHHRVAPAYLFTGTAGIGRRLTAERFAEVILSHFSKHPLSDAKVLRRRLVQRNHPEMLWVEPTYLNQGQRITAAEATALGLKRKSPAQIRLDQVREIGQFLSRPPLETHRAIVVIEGAETMAEAAANGLLKTLEEPGQATLILLAPDTHALLPTLVSRCQAIPFRRLNTEEMATVLERAGRQEILPQAEVLAMAEGSPGQAIAAYDQLQTLPPDLLAVLQTPPRTLRDALERGRHIAQALDLEAQLWLVDYLQHYYWQNNCQNNWPNNWLNNWPNNPMAISSPIEHLEKARKYLRSYVQPRLVWEVTWLSLLI
jgi:DNA polymerase-3 subunit delta'